MSVIEKSRVPSAKLTKSDDDVFAQLPKEPTPDDVLEVPSGLQKLNPAPNGRSTVIFRSGALASKTVNDPLHERVTEVSVGAPLNVIDTAAFAPVTSDPVVIIAAITEHAFLVVVFIQRLVLCPNKNDGSGLDAQLLCRDYMAEARGESVRND